MSKTNTVIPDAYSPNTMWLEVRTVSTEVTLVSNASLTGPSVLLVLDAKGTEKLINALLRAEKKMIKAGLL